MQRGYSLAEILVVMAVIGMTVSVTMPAFNSMRRRIAVKAAVAELRAIFHKARMRAIARGLNSGVRFSNTGTEWRYAGYDDGDGNGLRNEDIASGVDKEVFAPRAVLMTDRGSATISVPNMIIRDPDGDKLTPSSSPVQFNRSQLCSCTPTGSCTPGSIYLTDGANGIYCVRVYGATGRIRVLRWNDVRLKWEER